METPAFDTSEQIIEKVASTFPALRKYPTLEPNGAFNPYQYLKRVEEMGAGSGATHAARFIANLWDSTALPIERRFDLYRAIGCWDESNRAAFAAWVANPRRP